MFAIEQKKNEAGQTVAVARQKFVRTGERRGDVVAVTSGLEPGETVVSSGAFKLRNGVAVAVNNALAPDAQLAEADRRLRHQEGTQKFTDLFIRRPVIAIVVSLVIVIAGLQAIRSLNARQYRAARTRRSSSPRPTWARTRSWCAVSSPRRSSE